MTRAIGEVGVSVYEIPTDAPESDGTLEWSSTTMVLVTLKAGGETGLGYTYADGATATFIESKLRSVLEGADPFDIPRIRQDMEVALRNDGRPGVAAMAVSAVDTALWDLKGKLLGSSVAGLLGRARDEIPVYGSGGFTSYDEDRLASQLHAWVEEGCRWVKMKVGRDPEADIDRVAAAADAVGEAGLFVDANGAWRRKQALLYAETYAEMGVTWLEEPVSSEDRAGLRLIRDRAPAGVDVTTGEYGYDSRYFRDLLVEGCVDVLQADATRCGGISGFMEASALAEAFEVPLSSHCAPALHRHACLAARPAIHMEWFHDHVRIEQMLFEGAPQIGPGGALGPPDTPGLGLALREREAARFRL